MEINKKQLYCSDCAKCGISCTANKMPSTCNDFIYATSPDMREYIRWKVIAIMESLNVSESNINAVKNMSLEMF